MTVSALSKRDAAFGVVCSMILEDGRRWADTAEDYQRTNALAILDPDAVPRQSWIELPRGARKTTDLAAILLALLVAQAPPMARLYVGASSEDQSQELIDAASGLIARTPELAGVFRVHELEITNTHTGASVRALPADASAMGKRAWFIVLDEVANWPDSKRAAGFWNVLTSGTRKLAECRLVVITNAGSPEHWAWRRRETARTSEHWRLCAIPGPLPWLTEADLQVLRENATLPSVFERLHLNRWIEAEDRLVSSADLDAAMALPGPLDPVAGRQYVAGVDLGLTKDAAVVAVAHLEAVYVDWALTGTRVVVDRLLRWKGTRDVPVQIGDVEEALLELHAAFRPRVLVDPYQAAGLIQRLSARGVRIEQFVFSSSSVGRLAGTLFRLLRERRLDLPKDAGLREELAHVRLRESSPGVVRMDHDSGRHDDQATAIALAGVAALELQPAASNAPVDAAALVSRWSDEADDSGAVLPWSPGARW